MYKYVYDTFKHLYDKNGVIYLYSDPHFSDEEMYKLRGETAPFDLEKLDMEQVKKINSVVGKNDVIIFLGDIGNVEPIKKVRGYKILIMGNHEQGASNYKREVKYILDNERGKVEIDLNLYRVEDNHLFDEVYEGPLMINDRTILSHEPILGLPEYLFNIHGHTHSNKIDDGHHLNVCVEANGGYPVNFTRLMKEGLLKNINSIHQTTIDKATAKKQKRLAKK